MSQSSPKNSRRLFLQSSAAAITAADAARAASESPDSLAQNPGSLSAEQRRRRAFNLRRAAAQAQMNQRLPLHLANGDEQRYATRIASFSKALPHNELGEVIPAAYDALTAACTSGNLQALEAVPLAGPVKLANPLAALAYSGEGGDSHQFDLPPAPTFSSAEAAGELVEVYWRALTRDVAFSEYDSSPLIAEAAQDLSNLSDFKGAKSSGKVAPSTLFRGTLPGDQTGPFISQFLLADIPYGSSILSQRWRTFVPGVDYGLTYSEILGLQRGARAVAVQRDSVPRYIRNMRDLTAFVHLDYTFEAFLHAALILNGMGAGAASKLNPYSSSKTMDGFATFGAPMAYDLVSKSAVAALKAAWCHKWLIHRRIRPEAMAMRVQNHLTRQASYPLHTDLINSRVLDRLKSTRGTYLLPLAYPEGSPVHPSYPGGHAAIAGAAVTILKALFNESAEYPNPVVAKPDGLELLPYTSTPLTVGGELNKLASNMALGRDSAGVHYRSDEVAGLALGEAVAIEILQECKTQFAEYIQDFRFTRFDGIAERI